MITSLTYFDLTQAERDITDMYAWGMTKKEIANKRKRSVNTVDNQIAAIMEKTETHKDTELAAWYFCTKFKIPVDYSPIQRTIITICFLILISASTLFDTCPVYRSRVSRNKTETVRRMGKRNEEIE